MSTALVTSILKIIPWKDLIQHGPALLDSAKDLFKNSKEQNTKASIEEKIQRLEENEKEQAKLIEQLVERQEFVISAIQVINSRFKAAFICSILSVIGFGACIVIIWSR